MSFGGGGALLLVWFFCGGGNVGGETKVVGRRSDDTSECLKERKKRMKERIKPEEIYQVYGFADPHQRFCYCCVILLYR